MLNVLFDGNKKSVNTAACPPLTYRRNRAGFRTARKCRPTRFTGDVYKRQALRRPVGCDRCRNTGYRGRVGVFEIFRLHNDEIHDLILKRESTQALAECARRHGMKALEHSAWDKVRAGLTTLDEVLRVITVTDT